MDQRCIAVVTGSRADYGLLYCLMRAIQADPMLILRVIVTGMHLSPEFGNTYLFIEQDGFYIDAKIEMLLSGDSSVAISKSIGIGLIGMADVFARLRPDIVVVLGDRFESLAVAQAALMQHIPLAHIHGGELSIGAIDDAVRHAITKMAHLHFVATEPYRKRVIQLGEQPDRVFNIGAPGLERIKKLTLFDRDTLENQLSFNFGTITFLVTYHPSTLILAETVDHLTELLRALDDFPDAVIIFTQANADEKGRWVNAKLADYVNNNPAQRYLFPSMGDMVYLSLLQFVQVVVGNSSSGLIEAPYFGKPTVNIGRRQDRRLKSASVIDCACEYAAISTSMRAALSPKFMAQAAKVSLAYQQDNSAAKMVAVLKQVNLETVLIKDFYDIPVHMIADQEYTEINT